MEYGGTVNLAEYRSMIDEVMKVLNEKSHRKILVVNSHLDIEQLVKDQPVAKIQNICDCSDILAETFEPQYTGVVYDSDFGKLPDDKSVLFDYLNKLLGPQGQLIISGETKNFPEKMSEVAALSNFVSLKRLWPDNQQASPSKLYSIFLMERGESKYYVNHNFCWPAIPKRQRINGSNGNNLVGA